MPREGYLREFKNLVKNGSVDMERVAEKLNVSLSAAINRGRFLGVLS